jgi:hypothetical protein
MELINKVMNEIDNYMLFMIKKPKIIPTFLWTIIYKIKGQREA